MRKDLLRPASNIYYPEDGVEQLSLMLGRITNPSDKHELSCRLGGPGAKSSSFILS